MRDKSCLSKAVCLAHLIRSLTCTNMMTDCMGACKVVVARWCVISYLGTLRNVTFNAMRAVMLMGDMA